MRKKNKKKSTTYQKLLPTISAIPQFTTLRKKLSAASTCRETRTDLKRNWFTEEKHLKLRRLKL